jgi:hypothetical protein
MITLGLGVKTGAFAIDLGFGTGSTDILMTNSGIASLSTSLNF